MVDKKLGWFDNWLYCRADRWLHYMGEMRVLLSQRALTLLIQSPSTPTSISPLHQLQIILLKFI